MALINQMKILIVIIGFSLEIDKEGLPAEQEEICKMRIDSREN